MVKQKDTLSTLSANMMEPGLTPTKMLTDADTSDTGASLDWKKITGGIADGNDECFRVFYEHFFDLMFREVRRLVSADEQTCLDIVQDSMIKSIRSMKAIPFKSQLDAWVRTVVRSVTYDWLRRQRKQQAVRNKWIEEQRSRKPTHCDVEVKARLLWIQDQLDQVPPNLRQMIALRYRLGWSLDKIARNFGLKPGAVDGRIRRALEQIRRKADLEYYE